MKTYEISDVGGHEQNVLYNSISMHIVSLFEAMDVSRNIDRHRDAETRNDHGSFQMISTIVHVPLRLLVSLSSTTVATLRPYAPQIIPVLICVLFIPLIILLSVFSGFVVWRSVGVDWETPIHLQFGCVFSLSFNH